MSNIVNFSSASVPAFLQQAMADMTINNSLAALATGYPTISIKGKVFAVVRDGERHVITRPDDPTAPASSIMVIVANNSPKVKTYYAHGYTENAEDNKPTCFSNDGVKPDASVQNPQCSNCRMCPHNVFGTARNENGGFGKGKACSDSIRLAVITGNDDEVYLLRVPPASLRFIGQYSKSLGKIPMNGVLTKVSFDINAAAPQLQFQFAGFLDEEQYKRAVAMGKSDQALRIIGKIEEAVQAPLANEAATPFGTMAMTQPPAHLQQAAQPKVAPEPQRMQADVQAAPAPWAAAPQPTAQPVQQGGDDDLAALFDTVDSSDVPY